MSAADLTTIREARLHRVLCPEPGCTRKRGTAIKVTGTEPGKRGAIAPCPGCRGAGTVPDPAFDIALDRIEQNTLTPEEASEILYLAAVLSDGLVAKLERIAGEQT